MREVGTSSTGPLLCSEYWTRCNTSVCFSLNYYLCHIIPSANSVGVISFCVVTIEGYLHPHWFVLFLSSACVLQVKACFHQTCITLIKDEKSRYRANRGSFCSPIPSVWHTEVGRGGESERGWREGGVVDEWERGQIRLRQGWVGGELFRERQGVKKKKSEGGRLGGWASSLCMCVWERKRESCKQMCVVYVSVCMCVCVCARVCSHSVPFLSLSDYRVGKSKTEFRNIDRGWGRETGRGEEEDQT